MTLRRTALLLIPLALCLLAIVPFSLAQSESATLSGLITDPQGKVVPGAAIEVTNVDTNVTAHQSTNHGGLYVVVGLKAGRYRVSVTKEGFRKIDLVDLVLNVQDVLSRNFQLQLGSVLASITVTADAPNVNTTDASVSTVVDQKFIANMPLNGRSFQTLLTLAPGVEQVPGARLGSVGEISVNGQRTEANYFTVDGVSANTGTSQGIALLGAGVSGNIPGETQFGTTQSLVSIDALQEFRTSTSTYSAEYGRTPGGQFSFTTRSGTNAWHGSAYDYFRNEVMDANNWFNTCGCLGLPLTPRLPERQNNFGGTVGGPIVIPGLYSGKDKTFFFFSYEGLRLLVPQASTPLLVPDMNLRQQAPVPVQPFLNAFALPNGGEDGLNDGLARYNLVYSAPSKLDNVSVRIDQSFGDKLKVFGRYANTPSSSWGYNPAAIKAISEVNVRTLTVGATSSLTTTQANELRFNVTQNNTITNTESTNYGGATPFDITSLPGPNGHPASAVGTNVEFFLAYGGFPGWSLGQNINSQRQYNLVDNYTWSRGAHQLKFGADWRRLTTLVRPIAIAQLIQFTSEASVLANSVDSASVFSFTNRPVEPVYHNFSAFVEDEWKTTPRLSLSLGLRWDVNPPPGNLDGPLPYTVDQITNLSTTKLAPANTPLWNTDWHGFAPRAGLAYQLREAPSHQTVLRAGFGLFNDTGNAQGSNGFFESIGFTSSNSFSAVPLPLTSAQVTLPDPSVAPPYSAPIFAFNRSLKLPYTMQWNLAVEQSFGATQTLTVGYVGSAGRRLLAQFVYFPAALGNANFTQFDGLDITSNRASSAYNALQAKYQKRLSHGLQILASYTWSHSIDDASSNFALYELLRASSDFDIRHNFQAAITFDVPGTYSNRMISAIVGHWGLDTRIAAYSAVPVDVIGTTDFDPVTHQYENFHPDLVQGKPVYLYGSQYPGGRIINYNAFTPASAGVDGNTGRNFLRGFGAVQADLALRREFPIHDRLHLQFRAEAFNVFNHPNFGNVQNMLMFGPGLFGYAQSTLNNSLGGLSSLYQSGGPRSLQLMLKLSF